MATEGTALRKRQQIAKANRVMFFWIAGASVIVGAALVLSLFLVQKALFREKVLSEKAATANILKKNNETIADLKEEVAVLNTNEALKRNMLPGQEEPVQVVLDALPDVANSAAFGSSLQRRFLEVDGNGLTLESLDVMPVLEAETGVFDDAGSADSSGLQASNSDYNIRFNFMVSASYDSSGTVFRNLLQRLERSIRPITLTNIQLEVQGDRMMLQVEGETYYQPKRTAELTDKVVKP